MGNRAVIIWYFECQSRLFVLDGLGGFSAQLGNRFFNGINIQQVIKWVKLTDIRGDSSVVIGPDFLLSGFLDVVFAVCLFVRDDEPYDAGSR